MTDERRLYGDLAWTWPIISGKGHYVHEAETFVRVLREHARIDVRTLLHLGCGGGHLDFTLKKHLAVTGVDISAEMLALARLLNPEVRYHQGDMRAVRLGQTFDAVMIADSIDYMLTEDDLRAAFQTAAAHLKPGGAFCTYAEQTRERFRQNSVRCQAAGRDGVDIAFFENTYDPDPTDTTYENVFVFVIREDGESRIETDRHLGGLFPEESWVRLMRETGLEVTQILFEDADDQLPMFVGVIGT